MKKNRITQHPRTEISRAAESAGPRNGRTSRRSMVTRQSEERQRYHRFSDDWLSSLLRARLELRALRATSFRAAQRLLRLRLADMRFELRIFSFVVMGIVLGTAILWCWGCLLIFGTL